MTDPGPRGDAEEVCRIDQRVETARRQAGQAQLAAAQAVDKSADCHDRASRTYEQLAERPERRDEYLEHAARHREFAQEDRQIAQRLQQDAESDLLGGSPTETGGACCALLFASWLSSRLGPWSAETDCRCGSHV